MSTETRAALDTALGNHIASEVAVVRAEAQVDLAAVRAECAQTVARIQAELDAYKTSHPDPTPLPAQRTTVLGMSAPANLWDQRLREVGADGITARRIFADLTATGRDQSNLIDAAVAAGMTPVVTYKTSDVPGMLAGRYDAWLDQVGAYLDGLGVTVAAGFWHEPNGDRPDPWPADFRACSKRFAQRVQSSRVKVGPILNGWLLDNKVAQFTAFTDPELMNTWDFLGLDSYQSGTAESPGKSLPARAIPLVEKWLRDQGHPDMPVVLGEYNGHTAAAIKEAGDTILASKSVWIALAWNSTGGTYSPLVDDRLAAFKATKADLRVKR